MLNYGTLPFYDESKTSTTLSIIPFDYYEDSQI